MKLHRLRPTKKKTLAMILGVSMFFLAAAVSAPSLAWFIEIQDKTNTQNMSGVIHGAYFGGSGTQKDPYTISQPKQIYYFNWLQDIGYFNIKTSNQDLTQTYFKLTDDIDMTGFVLPPAGTTRFPFVGSFDGDGHTISNLTITNVYKDLTDPVTQSLDKQSMGTVGGHLKTLNNNDCEIVGFFGVIGDSDGELTTNHRTGYLLDDGKQNYTYKNGDEAADYVVAANVVKNVAFKNLTVDSHTTNTLSGLAAGFVNGTMSGVAVDDSSLSFSNTKQAALTAFTNNLSDYSLVGYAAPQFRGSVQKAEAKAIAPTVENPNSAQGGDQWGGSIDMRTMYKNVLATEQNATSRIQYVSKMRTLTPLEGEMEVENQEFTQIPSVSQGNSNYSITYDGVTTDTADTYEKVFSLETAEKGDETGYCGTWVYNAGNDQKTKLVLSSDGTGSLDGVPFSWNPETHKIKGFGMYDQGGAVLLSAGKITLSLSDSEKQTASMSINRWFRSNGTEQENYMYLYGGKENISVSNARVDRTDYVETADAAIYDGTNYLTVSGRNSFTIDNTTDETSATTHWTYSGTTLSTTINSTTVYLGVKSGSLVATTGTRTNWTYDEEQGFLKCSEAGLDYYLVYDNGWTLKPTELTIYSNTAGRYLNYNGSYMATSSTSSGTTWFFANNKYVPTADSSVWLQLYDTGEYPVVIYGYGRVPYYLNGDSSTGLGTGSLIATYNKKNYFIYWDGSKWAGSTESGDSFTIAVAPSFDESAYAMKSRFFNYTVTKSTPRATYSTKDTYFPLTWADSVGDGETVPTEVSDRNTGYVVSGANTNFADIRISYYDMTSLSTAFGTSANYSDAIRQRMEIVTNTYVEQADGTYKPSGWTLISDDDNKNNSSISDDLISEFGSGKKDYRADLKLEKYWNAKKGLKAMFSADTEKVYGLHFMNSLISTSHTISAPYVKINGKPYYDYELPEDSIDFNLASSGYVNFFAGSYFGSSNDGSLNDTFFSINEIDRDSNNDITSIHRISKIYINSDLDTKESQPYYYTYTDDTGGGHSSTGNQGTLVFDMDWVMSPRMVEKALYYFEIPVNSGEYALGSVKGKNGAYLLYLDIGASTANYKAVTITELIQGEGKSLVYPLGVDFVELTSAAFKKDMNLGGLTAAIIVPAQSTGVQHYKYDEDNEGGSLVVAPPQDKSFTGTLKASFVANNVKATDVVAEAVFTSTKCDGLTSSTMRIDRVTSETYDPWTYTVTQQIDSEYTLSGIPGTTLQLYAGGEGNASWAVKSGADDATVSKTGLVTFKGTGKVVITSTVNIVKNNVTEYSGPESVEASEDSAGGISYVITNGEASVSWSYDAYSKTYTVRVYSTVGATIAVTKPAEGYTIVITDGTNSTPITSKSQTTTVNIIANS